MKTLFIGFRGKHNTSAMLVHQLSKDPLLLTNSFAGLERDILTHFCRIILSNLCFEFQKFPKPIKIVFLRIYSSLLGCNKTLEIHFSQACHKKTNPFRIGLFVRLEIWKTDSPGRSWANPSVG